jgi:hypothetical protein
MEGQRFFDLRRYPSGAGYAADSAIPAYVAVEKARHSWLAGAVWQTRHHLYPIPQVQVELSKVAGVSKVVQNPGW